MRLRSRAGFVKPGGSLKVGVGVAVAAGLIAFPLVGGLATAGAKSLPPPSCLPEVLSVHSVGNAELSHVVIKGHCFESSKVSAVTFGSVGGSFTVKSDNTLTANPPAQAAGTVTVTVTNAAGTSKTDGKYTYLAPKVTQVSPNNGPTAGGNVVTIRGLDLADGSTPTVTFGTLKSSTVTVKSSRALTAVVPAASGGPGDVGSVGVTVTTTEGSSSGTIKYTYRYIA
jgi:hypothetical protein